ncbi:unnamed protein product [Rotaria sp. Silwood2]|nr:unnamed protein product [Rotaria sp. Silwood2]CAF3358177.1 unnamed protein product [Rotaria sp. Silwood2]CAF4428067.1 unnamed protein product [Rotaria sp. Silwood2]
MFYEIYVAWNAPSSPPPPPLPPLPPPSPVRSSTTVDTSSNVVPSAPQRSTTTLTVDSPSDGADRPLLLSNKYPSFDSSSIIGGSLNGGELKLILLSVFYTKEML